MKTDKRWLKQIIKEAANKHNELPRKLGMRPAAFADKRKSYEQIKVA